MVTFIKNILPRIVGYTEQLDKIESFCDRQWLLFDNDVNTQTYEFLRDGRLVMTFVSRESDQQTTIGKWEILPSSRMLIHRPEPLVLDHAFLGEGVLIFLKSGTNESPFCLYDPKLILDGNVERYLNSFIDNKHSEIPLANNKIIQEVEYLDLDNYSEENVVLYRKVHRNGTVFNEGNVTTYGDRILVISEGVIVKILEWVPYHIPNGEILIRQSKFHEPAIGCDVLHANKPAPDGEYKLNFFEKITTRDGKIVEYGDNHVLVLTLFFIFIVGGLLISVHFI